MLKLGQCFQASKTQGGRSEEFDHVHEDLTTPLQVITTLLQALTASIFFFKDVV